jgi:CRISPR/Cas system CSM-associated protein Csm3 (group 7 of RAMP superfamily)
MKQHSLHHSIYICEVKLKILMETLELLGRLPVWRNKLRGFGIKQIYLFFSMNLENLDDTQEAGKWWAFIYEILIIFYFHSQIFP